MFHKQSKFNDRKIYVIFGACGYGNIGDDCIALGITKHLLARQDMEKLFIFTYSPHEMERLLKESLDIRESNVHIGSYLGMIKFLFSSRRKKHIFIGGGTLITNNNTVFTLKYLLSAIVFRLLYSDVSFFGIASDNITKPIIKVCLKIVIKYFVSDIFVRDLETKAFLSSLQKGKVVLVIGDPASYLISDVIQSGNNLSQRHNPRYPLLVISFRDLEKKVSYTDVFANLLDTLIESLDGKVLMDFIPLCIHKKSKLERDDLFAMKIRDSMKHSNFLSIRAMTNPYDIMKHFSKADFCICMRLHSLIFAHMARKNCLAISYSSKVKSYAIDNNIPYVNAGEISTRQLEIIQYVLSCLKK